MHGTIYKGEKKVKIQDTGKGGGGGWGESREVYNKTLANKYFLDNDFVTYDKP